MTVSHLDLIQFGKALLESDVTSECVRRTSVNRSYYGAYHAAMAWHESLPEKGLAGLGKGGVHQVLLECLQNPTVGSQPLKVRSRSIGYMLQACKHVRTRADYHLLASLDEDEAHQVAENALLIVEKCSS